jgi:hypothetical protein
MFSSKNEKQGKRGAFWSLSRWLYKLLAAAMDTCVAYKAMLSVIKKPATCLLLCPTPLHCIHVWIQRAEAFKITGSSNSPATKQSSKKFMHAASCSTAMQLYFPSTIG